MPITSAGNQSLGLFMASYWESNKYLPFTVSLHCIFPLYPLTTAAPLQPAIPVLAVLHVEIIECLRQQQDEKHPLARLTVCAQVELCSYHQKWISDLSMSWGQVLYLSDLDSLIYTHACFHTYFSALRYSCDDSVCRFSAPATLCSICQLYCHWNATMYSVVSRKKQ